MGVDESSSKSRTARLRRRRRMLHAIREPDPHAVATVADKLGMDATKVAAVWMLLIDEALR